MKIIKKYIKTALATAIVFGVAAGTLINEIIPMLKSLLSIIS